MDIVKIRELQGRRELTASEARDVAATAREVVSEWRYRMPVRWRGDWSAASLYLSVVCVLLTVCAWFAVDASTGWGAFAWGVVGVYGLVFSYDGFRYLGFRVFRWLTFRK